MANDSYNPNIFLLGVGDTVNDVHGQKWVVQEIEMERPRLCDGGMDAGGFFIPTRYGRMTYTITLEEEVKSGHGIPSDQGLDTSG